MQGAGGGDDVGQLARLYATQHSPFHPPEPCSQFSYNPVYVDCAILRSTQPWALDTLTFLVCQSLSSHGCRLPISAPTGCVVSRAQWPRRWRASCWTEWACLLGMQISPAGRTLGGTGASWLWQSRW